MYFNVLAILLLISHPALSGEIDNLYKAPLDGVHTRWVSPENPTGAVGAGGKTNKGAKGNAFYIIPPHEKKILFNVKGSGVIKRIWMAGDISFERRRHVRIDMYWDNAETPAVSAPIGDFFWDRSGSLTCVRECLVCQP